MRFMALMESARRCVYALVFILVCANTESALAKELAQTLRVQGRVLEIAVLDVPDPTRAAQLQAWVRAIARSTQTLSGRLPLKHARIEVREIDSSSNSAVPWGQTDRSNRPVKVLLYVRRDATLAQLRADWTAPHELAHLYHPYLGRSGRWLAEGFASYQQNRFMARAGVLAVQEAWERLDAGFARGAKDPTGGPLASVSYTGTMRLYWAGAAFWLDADIQLRKRGSSLDQVMDRYLRCCMQGEIDGVAPAEFIRALDQQFAPKAPPLLLPLFQRYSTQNTFPDTSSSYQVLGLTRSVSGLQFSAEPKAAFLREKIMYQPSPKKQN
jgi:hypothetical protein